MGCLEIGPIYIEEFNLRRNFCTRKDLACFISPFQDLQIVWQRNSYTIMIHLDLSNTCLVSTSLVCTTPKRIYSSNVSAAAYNKIKPIYQH